MRKWLEISLMLLLMAAAIPSGAGLHLVRADASGRLELADCNRHDAHGLAEDGCCLHHLKLTVSQYSTDTQHLAACPDGPSACILPCAAPFRPRPLFGRTALAGASVHVGPPGAGPCGKRFALRD